MIHNGIEYGLMAPYAEGQNILHPANAGKGSRQADAETAPLRNPEYYQHDVDLPEIAEVWRRGSVIASWMLDLTAATLLDSSGLKTYAGRASDSREGRRMIASAIDETLPTPVLCLVPRCMSVSARAKVRMSPTACCPRCARRLTGTTRRRKEKLRWLISIGATRRAIPSWWMTSCACWRQ
jgi:6-phosphogluconate dehydrogenase (decarboxylating)